jgi:hypothetical protein
LAVPFDRCLIVGIEVLLRIISGAITGHSARQALALLRLGGVVLRCVLVVATRRRGRAWVAVRIL